MTTFSFQTYTKQGGDVISIVAGREVGRISIRDVESWVAYPEMTFDIVELRMLGGKVVRWLDRQDDLLKILRTEIGTRERPA
jgi:hypothetical protein